jgi:predicted ATPase with chaperone activity
VCAKDSYLDDLMARLSDVIVEQGADGAAARENAARENAAASRRSFQEPAAQGAPAEEAPDAINSDPRPGEFWPLAPADWEAMKTTPEAAEELVLKCLMGRGTLSGRAIADHIAVPFGILCEVLEQLKTDRLVTHRGAAQLGDYLYQPTENGVEAARRYTSQCAYDGAAPITLPEYVESVKSQSIHRHPPTFDDIARVFSDLVLSEVILEQVGQAIRAGHGFFLYGDSGNGKTSIAERVSRAFGQTIWIPRSLSIDGLIIRLFDPCNHVEVPPENKNGLYDQLKIDRRWVRIRRPTILVGGELTMDRLEVRSGAAAGVNEAPLQLKSNCGTLVIDDFGRQRMRAEELLNRWIVPLDRRYDFLNLPNGKAIQVPFDQLLIFSTNMEPHDLADEAFLRRIPYKIRALNPSEEEFRELFRREALRLEIRYDDATIDELIQTHYLAAGRSFRCCHARDLLLQIKHFCEFKGLPLEMSAARFAQAVQNYFAVVQ